jgi:hypothetical protein
MIDTRARHGPRPGAEAGPKSADEVTASWRDSLRGARLRRAAARGGAEDPAAFSLTADAGGDDASRRAVEDTRPEPEPAREENAKGTTPFLDSRLETRLESDKKKSPKSPEVSLEHLSAVRLTADERLFLARLAKERALVTDRARHGAAAAAAAAGLDPRRVASARVASRSDRRAALAFGVSPRAGRVSARSRLFKDAERQRFIAGSIRARDVRGRRRRRGGEESNIRRRGGTAATPPAPARW